MKKNLLILLIFTIVSLALLEFGLFLGTRQLNLNMDTPGYSLDTVHYRFWADIHPAFGTWHQPNSKYHLTKSCIDVHYQANSYGARDVERAKNSEDFRGLILGDSFMEGYGVADAKRVSNLLEQQTGIPLLNFATSGGFGITQSYLLYKNLAKHFDHDFLILGILPFNDFFDDDPDIGEQVYPSRYKPYLMGEYPDYKIEYSNTPQEKGNKLKRLLKGFSYTYNAIERILAVSRVKLYLPDQNQDNYSGYYDYTPPQFDRLKFALEEIQNEASGKTMVVFTIPVIGDFIRYQKHGEPKLTREMKIFAKERGMVYFDLLPEMIQGDWAKYSFACDNHWSPHGNTVVAQILYEKLSGILWKPKTSAKNSISLK